MTQRAARAFLLQVPDSVTGSVRLVPGERFELPTNGLQNRCSTPELTRHYALFSFYAARLATGLLLKFQFDVP